MDSNLYRTIQSGDVDDLKQILSAADDDDDDFLLQQTTPLKNTTLHVAVQFRSSCCEEIYKRCPSLSIQANSNGDTPLHIAARLGFIDAVSFFIKQSKVNRNDIGDNKDDGGGVTAAVDDGSSTLTPVQQLVRMGNRKNDTALHEAVRNHNFQIVKILTEADPGFEYFANKAGETPLYLAVEATLFNFADQILETCPSSAHVGPLGRTALHDAAMKIHSSDIISLLLEKKPSIIKEVDDFGLSALHYVAYYNNVGQVVQLLEAGPSVAYIGDKAGKTALHYAAMYSGRNNVIEQLIEHCPDCWELLDNKGQNFLHVVAENGTDDVFKHFMSNNSHQSNNRMMENLINHPDINGDTPLHLAIKSEWFDTAKIICKRNGVGKMAMNNDNLTALNLVDPEVERGNYNDLYMLGASECWRMKHIHGGGDGGGDNVINGNKEQTDEKIMTADTLRTKASKKKKQLEAVMKINETHLVVATLIATVAFAAGFTLPGGYNSDGPHKGMAVLIRKPAFIVFVISNSTAMLLSTFAVFVHFWAKVLELLSDRYGENYHAVTNLFVMALLCTFGSIIAMVVAFVTGTYTVLLHLPGLAIPLCIFGCSFFIFCGLLFYKLKKWDS